MHLATALRVVSKMLNDNLQKIAWILGISCVVPALGYFLGLSSSNLIAKLFGVRPNPKLRKMAATFFLALPVFSLFSFARIDRDGLHEWYTQSPVLATTSLVLFLIVGPVLLAVAIINVWRRKSSLDA